MALRCVDWLIYWLSWLWCAPALGIMLRLRCWGQAHIPRSGPLILACNHQSYLDPILAAACVPRRIHYMARDSLFRRPVFALLIRRYQAFPVRRGGRDVAAFRHTLRLLGAGQAVLVFPEGTRTPDGRIRPVQAGFIALARRSGARILPIAVEGAFDAWPRHAHRPRPARIWLAYGTPIEPADLAEQTDAEAAVALTTTLRDLHNRLRRRAGRPVIDYSPATGGEVPLPESLQRTGASDG